MKRLLILWLLLPLLSAAKVPVESDIKARIEDPASEQYYPNLRLRYEQADSTLTAEDYTTSTTATPTSRSTARWRRTPHSTVSTKRSHG